MKIENKMANLLFWGLVLLLQWFAGMLIIFLLSLLLGQFVENQAMTLGIWLLMLSCIAAGFILGIWGVGELAYRVRSMTGQHTPASRLLLTALGVLLPLLILLVLGVRLGLSNVDKFEIDILSYWQPKLASASPFTGILGFYWLGGKKRMPGS